LTNKSGEVFAARLPGWGESRAMEQFWRMNRARTGREFKAAVAGLTGGELRAMDFGVGRVQRVGIVSGGGSDCLAEAANKGLDVFLSGEPTLMAYHLAADYGINAVFAGHYATECFGVRALGEWIEKECGLPVEFLRQEIPF